MPSKANFNKYLIAVVFDMAKTKLRWTYTYGFYARISYRNSVRLPVRPSVTTRYRETKKTCAWNF